MVFLDEIFPTPEHGDLGVGIDLPYHPADGASTHLVAIITRAKASELEDVHTFFISLIACSASFCETSIPSR